MLSYCQILVCLFRGPELYWYCRSDPEWLAWQWCRVEWKSTILAPRDSIKSFFDTLAEFWFDNTLSGWIQKKTAGVLLAFSLKDGSSGGLSHPWLGQCSSQNRPLPCLCDWRPCRWHSLERHKQSLFKVILFKIGTLSFILHDYHCHKANLLKLKIENSFVAF